MFRRPNRCSCCGFLSALLFGARVSPGFKFGQLCGRNLKSIGSSTGCPGDVPMVVVATDGYTVPDYDEVNMIVSNWSDVHRKTLANYGVWDCLKHLKALSTEGLYGVCLFFLSGLSPCHDGRHVCFGRPRRPTTRFWRGNCEDAYLKLGTGKDLKWHCRWLKILMFVGRGKPRI